MDERENIQPSQSAVSFLAKVWGQSPEGLRILDWNGMMLDVNAAFCRMVQKPRSELLGKPFYIIYAERDWKECEHKQRVRFAHHTVPLHSEKEVELWNGSKVWLDVSNNFSEERDQSAALFSVFKDVTLKKKMEESARIATERYQFIFNKIESVYFETSLDGIILELSPSIENHYGYRRAELVGQLGHAVRHILLDS